MKTVVAMLPSYTEGIRARLDLEKMGIPPGNISVVSGPEADEIQLHRVEMAKRTDRDAFVWDAVRGAVGVGLITLGLLLLAGAGYLGYGKFIALLISGCAIGALFCGVMGILDNIAHTHEDEPLYDEAMREHGTAVAAHVLEDQEGPVMEMFREHSARDMRSAEDVWTAIGWRDRQNRRHVNEHPDPWDSSIASDQSLTSA
jgi:hypothetical protein